MLSALVSECILQDRRGPFQYRDREMRSEKNRELELRPVPHMEQQNGGRGKIIQWNIMLTKRREVL